ncbi:MAG: hypothetical protein K2X47_13040 [Bdellovibrionales bacterium]|nr:hypothetical protein [Bdellovibrionales bacterium]
MIEGLSSYLQETLGLAWVLGTPTPAMDLCVALECDPASLPEKQSELLTRILEAGLKVSVSRVQWLTLPHGSDLPHFLNNAIGLELVPEVPLLVFGEAWDGAAKEKGHFGQVFEVHGLQVLVTHGLREISESEAIKREAWTHLQKLKGRIPNG